MIPTIAAKIQKAQQLINAGSLSKAETLCVKILESEPRQPDVLHLLGLISLCNGQYNRAVQFYTVALKARPKHAIYHYNLGLAHLRAGQYELAVEYLRDALQFEPELTEGYSDLCMALMRAGRAEAAVESGKVAVTRAPESAAAHYNLALAYDGWRDFETAFLHYQKAAQLLPDHPGILYDLGNAHASRGDTKAARQCYLKAIQLSPRQIEPYTTLVHISDYSSPDHEDINRLKTLLNQDWLNDDNRTAIFFALAKVYQECGLYDDAFAYFKRGNHLQDNKHQYSADEIADYVSSVIKFYNWELLAEKRELGDPSEAPVFIVGMPRTGTTLVEQILSSHPDVFAAGELSWFAAAADALPGYLQTPIPYPECLRLLSKSNSGELSSKYLRYIHTLAGKEDRITDKMPQNFLLLGLIHILFPNARIIHCRRDPRDACVSMYCNWFPGGLAFSYNLFKLGAYYAQYQRIMAHWQAVLPAGLMMEVNYERMVHNQEAESRRLVEFLGLEWNDACLAFHENKRRVYTNSNLQVKKPMYSSSVGRWKVYAKYLQPLEDGFNYFDSIDR